MIVNPAFDSQTKETLNTRASEFGSTCKLPDSFLQKVAKSGVIDSILSFATFKANKDMKKSDGSKKQRLTGISKLDDANDAGGRNSEQCTLILTEGDSAKALAVSGLSVVGRDKYGVFPLRGKLLNVRDAPAKQLTENAEITNIKQIMGLQQGKHYDSTKSLRYGHLMIMTDQDHDGSHIKGLLINFLHAFWPSLLKQPNFLLEFITPIVKATGPRGKVISFYTIPEYESWKESLGGSTKGWSIKYYKGLGTSTPKEAKEYFAALDQHRKSFEWTGEEDGESIEMAFSKKKVEDRKTWLRNVEPGTFLDQSAKTITYSDFVNKELVLFSIADNLRSIPSVMDGLKPGQRKILFSCFKRKLKSDVKGTVEHNSNKDGRNYIVTGTINKVSDTVLEITELPIRTWTQNYKEYLEGMMVVNDKNKEPFIKDIQLEQLRNELIKLDNRVRFILAVVRGEIIVSNRKKAELLAELKEKKFATLPKGKVSSSGGSSTAADEEGDDEGEESGEEEGGSKAKKGGDGGYDYLLGMPLWSLTLERVQELLRDQKKNQDDHDALLKTEPKDLWESDLDLFLEELEVAEEEAAQDKAKEVAGKPTKGKGRVAKAVAAKPKKAQKKAQVFSDEEMDFISDSDDDFMEDAKVKRGKGAASAAAKPTVVAATAKPQAPVPLVQVEEPALGDQFEYFDEVDIKSPVKEPVSKVQRMRPSPFSKKSGQPAAAAAERRTHLSRGAQKKQAVVLSDDSDESEEESEDDFQDFSEEEY
ncbi:unnamed protein product [Closterium sp. Naga37s-1]|nr:unnamed protein product [Closterium sp. Naga37s-1]